MAFDFSECVKHLPPELLADADAAFQAYGLDQLPSLLTEGACPSCQCETHGVPRHRWQDTLIENSIPAGASVLDLGCGEGDLLRRLMRDKQVRGQGVEMDFDAVLACIANQIPVFQANLDEGLTGFANHSFDFVILEETVQTLHRPLRILKEMLRVGRRGFVSFPNFGCWNVRLSLAMKGRMPVTDELPYHWYDTPNIHLLTLEDFFSWTRENRVKVTSGHAFLGGCVRPLDYPRDNLLAEEVLLAIEPD